MRARLFGEVWGGFEENKSAFLIFYALVPRSLYQFAREAKFLDLHHSWSDRHQNSSIVSFTAVSVSFIILPIPGSSHQKITFILERATETIEQLKLVSRLIWLIVRLMPAEQQWHDVETRWGPVRPPGTPLAPPRALAAGPIGWHSLLPFCQPTSTLARDHYCPLQFTLVSTLQECVAHTPFDSNACTLLVCEN